MPRGTYTRGIFVLASCATLAMSNTLTSAQPLRKDLVLTASAGKPRYVTGERVQFRFTLMNRSRIAVKVSNLADGNFHVRAATRNGANIQPSTTVIDYDVDLAAAITENVVRLPARRTISVVLESEPRPNLGGQVMQFVDIGPTENAGTFYSIAAPGTYEFKVFYRFGGKAGGGLSTGETNTATIRFIVR